MAQTTTPTRNVTIQGAVFTLSDPYTEGHPCTAMEAKALNQTRAENIRNNFASVVKKAQAEDGSLTDEAKASLEAELKAYEGAYEFSVGAGRSLDPIEKEAKAIATSLVDGLISKKGLSKAKYIEANGKDKYDSIVAGVMDKPEVQEKAASIVKERESLASSIKI